MTWNIPRIDLMISIHRAGQLSTYFFVYMDVLIVDHGQSCRARVLIYINSLKPTKVRFRRSI